ncbi:MAG: hypothetical protein Q9162_006416 [Coniocarpon cinnabarinum]
MHSFLSTILVWSANGYAKSFWSTRPADQDVLIQEAYPLGNGYLGALPAGSPAHDVVNINVDSLWTGGPFQNLTYNGGNPNRPVHNALPDIRRDIFTTGQGNITALWTDGGNSYGSYTPLANLTVALNGVETYENYQRMLDLDSATHTVQFESGGDSYQTTVFCNYPDEVCVYSINSSATLPEISFAFQNMYLNSSATTLNYACASDAIRFQGTLTKPGMSFDSIARVLSEGGVNDQATCQQNSLTLPANTTQRVTVILAAGTNYDQTAGDAARNYSFQGADPSPYVEAITSAASQKSFADLLSSHTSDFKSLSDAFQLDLPDPSNSSSVETSSLLSSYVHTVGDAYVESLLFDYGRYLLITSSRTGSLPANLNGRWAVDQYPAWSGDYHVDINLQMNYWLASPTGLAFDIQSPLFDYMSNTWPGYGQRTAEQLYNVTNGGFVTHGQVDTFGYTGMEDGGAGGEIWADYQAGAAWMAQQVTSYYSYYGNTTWYQSQGYPLLKSIALFWLEYLQKDTYFNDNTLVAAPCNSPEHGPVTFGCAHYQQVVWELFDSILATWADTGDSDSSFRSAVESAHAMIDRGVRVGSWGELQEWKIPTFDMQNDTHRHLSHLVGWYPGYSIAGTADGVNQSITAAIETTLRSRGNGTGPDADSGWEKVWRAACWAGLNNTDEAYFEVKYAIERNFAVGNGLSMYSARNPPFQVDANYGITAAMLSMLVRDLPMPYGSEGTRIVVLGPAIPRGWAGGSVRGLRVRGGGSVDFGWDEDGVVTSAKVSGTGSGVEMVNVKGEKVA